MAAAAHVTAVPRSPGGQFWTRCVGAEVQPCRLLVENEVRGRLQRPRTNYAMGVIVDLRFFGLFFFGVCVA